MARILIVEARFYAHLNDLLLDGALAVIKEAGYLHEVVTVPGALEIPGAVALAAETGRYDAFVALGVVIRGETYHFEIVAGESARGLMALTLDGLAVGNGILTVENEAQALARARPDDKDKGGEGGQGSFGHAGPEGALRLTPCLRPPAPRRADSRYSLQRPGCTRSPGRPRRPALQSRIVPPGRDWQYRDGPKAIASARPSSSVSCARSNP
jgi:6,7-dimethyl-8-ribityllumazine synthase